MTNTHKKLRRLKQVWLDHPVYFITTCSSESYSQKWDYVWNNPVRAGLVDSPDDWPYWGVIDDLSFH